LFVAESSTNPLIRIRFVVSIWHHRGALAITALCAQAARATLFVAIPVMPHTHQCLAIWAPSGQPASSYDFLGRVGQQPPQIELTGP
ncbi:MAG: hypothetical protein ACI9EF_003357, partial [Pseudohongiellaceae bacterium]